MNKNKYQDNYLKLSLDHLTSFEGKFYIFIIFNSILFKMYNSKAKPKHPLFFIEKLTH